jgi:hypothetical protein
MQGMKNRPRPRQSKENKNRRVFCYCVDVKHLLFWSRVLSMSVLRYEREGDGDSE